MEVCSLEGGFVGGKCITCLISVLINHFLVLVGLCILAVLSGYAKDLDFKIVH